MNEKRYRIRYLFNFENQNSHRFDLSIDARSMVIVDAGLEKTPSWTALDYHPCRCCPLDKKDSDKNAILVFHSLAQILSKEIQTNLQSIDYLFSPQP